MSDTKYNGWTNYATWRVNLEMFDGITANEFSSFSVYATDCAYELGQELKEYAEQLLSDTNPQGLALDYAFAFLGEVNFFEIAQHMINDYVEENESC